MPEKGSILKFKNFCNSERMPFSVYADTESLLKNIKNSEPEKPNKSYTKKYQKHVPISFSYYIKCFDDNVYKPKLRSYTGVDAMEKFVEWLERDVREIAKIPYKDMEEFTPELLDQYEAATKCWICGKDLNGDKVRDHCHYTGKYRGAAHNKCNLNYRKPKNIPVIMHNLSGYDSHLFIKNLGFTEGNIDCIANNDEKYITFSKNIKVDYMNREKKYVPGLYKIRFIDSLKFMNESLDSLVNNLRGDAFKNLEKYYSGDKLNLVKRKGVYPYDYMDTEERFKENCLPPKEAFYSKLNGGGITDKDYEHAKKVWDVFEMKTLGEYHNLYNETDVLLLADVFENFRNICLEHYGLDPAHYLTAPGLAWDACLKMTGVNLELLTDVDMLLMVERGIRGGVSMISKRYGRANNKYMGDSFISSLISTFLAYLDANNLYGVAMSMKLPTHGFKWMTEKELSCWESHPCILEVDLEYPKKLHDLHNDYPLAPERIMCKNNIEKLIPNLRNKERYVLHYQNLMQYMKLGLQLKKIHRGISFEESEWLKPYIDLNTELRAKAINKFEKDFFKLMNNSAFGKTMENIRKRKVVKLLSDRNKAKKYVAKPNFKHLNIFNEELIGVHMKKTSLTMDKPIYLGMSISDLSKTVMYNFHYEYIKPKYGDKAKLLFTDTDSLMYQIETKDFFKDISGDVNKWFDTSNFPSVHPSGIPTGCNNKMLGKFKDEAGGKIIEEFVGLRAKLYSLKMFEGKEIKKCKGVKRVVVENCLPHDNFLKCLKDREEKMVQMNVIRSYGHEVFTEEVNKVGLSANDDKRYIRKGGIKTYAWWHYKIATDFITNITSPKNWSLSLYDYID